MDAYESWVRKEMEAAQAKLDDMTRALAVYHAWHDSQDQTITVRNSPNATFRLGEVSISVGRRQRASKNDAIFAAFETAGPAGLSQEDVQRVAHENGLNSSPNTLRALCWNGKNKGILISLAPGRYAIAPKNETASGTPRQGDTDAVSARSDHNHHRVGDEGGGI